ncbi:DUF11 domain-containing protein [Microvirga massiliensis]|uniref:DUF11 domain-containing protein n=1 Tax=Microvirga massiliensis TaxID=1033741 RepID=UPI000660097E|nr:DUF11 domain-containing protein [Microvirga massiliensis]
MSNRTLMRECGSSDLAGLERVAFFPGQLLTAVDLTAEQDHVREKLRRHNRFLHGWGVVCGLTIVADPTDEQPWRLRIQPGYALDQAGDEIFVGESVHMDLAKCSAGAATDPCEPRLLRPGSGGTGTIILLAIKYAECKARPVRAMPAGCGCSDETCEFSRIRDSFSIECLSDLPASHAVMPHRTLCDILEQKLPVPCPPVPPDLFVVIGRIKLPPAPATKITDDQIDNMTDRRIVFSAAMLQEQLIACCCGDATTRSVSADLAIDKRLSRNGRTVTCDIAVTNNGPSRAENVVVTDTLGGVTVAQVGGFEPDQSWTRRNPSAPLVAALGAMEPGQVVRLRFQAIMRERGVLTNRARVTSDTVDPDTHNNEVVRSLDLGSAEPVRSDLGVKLDFERREGLARIAVRVHNGGPNAVTGALLKLVIKSDPLPITVVTEGARAPTGPWTSPFPRQRMQTCQLDAVLGAIAVNQDEVLTVVIEKAARDNAVVRVEAHVEPPSGATDPNPGNNTDQQSFDL